MQRQRGELVPIGEVIGGLDGPVKALLDAPQARHHFTQTDQVNQLVSASEADPDLGFMARLMALCSLPRTNPGNRKEYRRVNGPYRLYMQAGPENKLPYGNLPGCVPKRCGSKAARSSWVVRFPGSCGSWISTAPAAEAGESGHGFATR